MNYYQFHIGDYASHTKGLSLLEDLAFRRLLDEYYLGERPLNGCSTDVARMIGMRGHEAEVEYVLKTFFTLNSDGRWENHRADSEIQRFKIKSEKASQAGKASAGKRNANKSTNYEQTPNERSTDVEQTLNERQLTNNQEPITNRNTPHNPPRGDSPDEQTEKPPLATGSECKAPVNGSAIAFKTFIARCKASDERPIADYEPVWKYAEKAGIDEDVVVLCWQEFSRRHGEGGVNDQKRYRDWRAAFRKCVEGNWYNLWTLDEQGRVVLTSKGRIADRVTQ